VLIRLVNYNGQLLYVNTDYIAAIKDTNGATDIHLSGVANSGYFQVKETIQEVLAKILPVNSEPYNGIGGF
jgi:uncharacterized protein YlzI (FlbEa/FlbD family)